MGSAFKAEDATPLSEEWSEYIYRCLDCRACETACPSGVHFGELLEQARAIYEQNAPAPLLIDSGRTSSSNKFCPIKNGWT